MRRLGIPVIAGLVAALVVAPAQAGLVPGSEGAGTRYGAVEFPEDEHQHLDGWDYWWGAADLLTEAGNRYTVGIAFVSFNGVGITGHQIFPRQGPYAGRSIMTPDGPAEWGHPGETPPGRFVRKMSVYVPGVSDLLKYETLDASSGLKDIGRWERTSLERETYHLRIDNDAAKVHPRLTGEPETVRAVLDLTAGMQSPPLLAGGTGNWWYGIPQAHGYPSRSFQYMQAAATLNGTLTLEQPDGSVLTETVVPVGSTLVMVHEYDATPEDLPVGLARAEATQLHPRYAQYYEGGMPWELIFLDLKNGAQLMLAVLAFHEASNGTLQPLLAPDQFTYRVLATLRLQSGESVPLDDDIRVEHLSYRTIVGKVPTFMVQTLGLWTQAWEYRVSYPGGAVTVPDGTQVVVPSFDLGVAPQFAKDEPAVDDRGNRLTQRVPFVAGGCYDGSAVEGFGWSEVIINWYGYEDRDPWFTGGAPPVGCGSESNPPAPEPPAPPVQPPPNLAPQGCVASSPGSAPTCEYDAAVAGGISGYGSEPGGWTVTVARPDRADPIVVTSFGGAENYPCGTIRPGDHVIAEARPGSGVATGNPGICY